MDELPREGDSAADGLRTYRGWDDSWHRAGERTRDRDTTELEAVTDQLAVPAYDVLTAADRLVLVRLLEPLARAASGALPCPNAMGLRRLTADRPPTEAG